MHQFTWSYLTVVFQIIGIVKQKNPTVCFMSSNNLLE